MITHTRQEAHTPTEDKAVFFDNPAGRAVAAFSDAAFVRADALVIDPDGSVHAVLHEAARPVGHVSPEMAALLVRQGEVLAAAVHSHGHVVDLPVPVWAARSRAH
ncbi:MAG TPA: hypothetical protein PKX87_05070 [Alphaproteobacteria bacterium]|nr:hypothetical protein [Alphaproteobacteria bacterium]